VAERARWEFAADRAIRDANGDLAPSVSGVKVRWFVLPVIHGNHYAEKATNLGH
jgi:hypothetical protein